MGTRVLLWGGAAMLAFAIAMPGTFRLIVLQPPRDMLFFHRELQPFSDLSGIEVYRPLPDDTVVLQPVPGSGAEVEIHLDLWLPAADSAPVALLLHGSSPRGRKLGFNRMLADWLRSAGWMVITPDSRGYGDSPVPADRASPESWHVRPDLERLVDYARGHPRGNGVITAIGHSFGGSQLVDAGFDTGPFQALVLIGPGRYRLDQDHPGIWTRIRFSSDRRLARPISHSVVSELNRRHDLARLADARTEESMHMPVLLMDGAREGEELIGLLRETAEAMTPPVTHVTVDDSHHYCSAYQLPLLEDPVFVRPGVFERCATIVATFLFEALDEGAGARRSSASQTAAQ